LGFWATNLKRQAATPWANDKYVPRVNCIIINRLLQTARLRRCIQSRPKSWRSMAFQEFSVVPSQPVDYQQRNNRPLLPAQSRQCPSPRRNQLNSARPKPVFPFLLSSNLTKFSMPKKLFWENPDRPNPPFPAAIPVVRRIRRHGPSPLKDQNLFYLRNLTRRGANQETGGPGSPWQSTLPPREMPERAPCGPGSCSLLETLARSPAGTGPS